VSQSKLLILVGLLQGVLEWLPISSQGNVVILMASLLGIDFQIALIYSIYLHASTGLAALIYFRKDVIGIITLESDEKKRLFKFLLISTIFTGIIGLPLYLFIKNANVYGEALLSLIGIALLATGLVQKRAIESNDRSSHSIEIKEGIIMGLIQGFSSIPGISRSGLTSSALLMMGFSGEEAFKISFLMSIPAVFAASLGLIIIEGLPIFEINMLISVIASFVSAVLTIDVLLRIAKKIRLWSLCILLGALALIPQLLLLIYNTL
jgi:undecaprenyl-diphosphatase